MKFMDIEIKGIINNNDLSEDAKNAILQKIYETLNDLKFVGMLSSDNMHIVMNKNGTVQIDTETSN